MLKFRRTPPPSSSRDWVVAELSERITRQHTRAEGFVVRAGVLLAALGIFGVGLYLGARQCADPRRSIAEIGVTLAVLAAIVCTVLLYPKPLTSGPNESQLATSGGGQPSQDAAIIAMVAAIHRNDVTLQRVHRNFRIAVILALASATAGALMFLVTRNVAAC